MNAAHFHLIVNHFPVVASVLGVPILLWGGVRRDPGALRAAAALFIVAAVFGAAAYWSGEGAEDRLERFAAPSHDLVEEHEEAAEFATIAVGLLGAASLALLALGRGGRPVPKWMVLALLALSVVAAAAIARTANLGGRIRHPEILDAPPAGAPLVPAAERHD